MDDSPIKSVLSLLENAIKLFVALGAVLYGFGFITVALHYSRYNVTSLSLLNTDYVVAGLLSLLPLIILSAITGVYFSKLSEEEGCLRRLWVALGGLVILTLILRFVLGKNFSYWTVFLFLLIVIVIVFLFYIILKGIADNNLNGHAMAFASIVYLIPCLFVYTALFAYSIYPRIPRTLGGGRPTHVRFSLKELPIQSGSNPANAETGQSSSPKSPEPIVALARDPKYQRFTVPYRLLLATDKTYVILQADNDGSTYEFPKDAVSGIVFYPE